MNKKTRKSNSNNNNNNNKKLNQGGIKRKKGKSSSTTSSEESKKPKSKKKPVDPSKQKKQEIMEQIKAKIKEEGDEKKRKEKRKENQKPKQKQTPKKNQQQQQEEEQRQEQPRQKSKISRSESKDTTPNTAQARLQQIADDDPTGSAFDDEDDLDIGESTKRKKLFMNPFEAGKSFREKLQNLSTLGLGLQLPKETKDKYFLDDRLLDGDDADSSSKSKSSGSNTIAGAMFSSSSLLQSNFNSKTASGLLQEYAEAEALAPNAYIPEVLVVGATGEIGRLVVRRLLLEGSGRFRVRVLVRDLYSQTLNLLGTGVSYCQGDLRDVESLEYALTDVDKIVYVAGAPKPDETDFQKKFQRYLEEHDLELSSTKKKDANANANANANSQLNDLRWEQMASVLEVRSELAEQVDCIGMKNLVSAYQNVRHTDYGTSQAAKRSLFKFSKKSGDFDLFALDDSDDEDDDDTNDKDDSSDEPSYDQDQSHDYGDEEYDEDQDDDEDNYGVEEYDEDKYVDEYGDEYDEDENYGLELESRNARDSNVVKAQVRWLRNKFDNGVFVGRVPRADGNSNPGGAEASLISSRLQAREDPDQGIDMSGFAGFILRVISDGNNYEAFVRTGLYETDGVEYVYEYSTDSKQPTADNRSKSRFKTIRLAFENFKPVQRRKSKTGEDDEDGFEDDDDDDDVFTVPPFVGSDVRYLGFRFRSSSNIGDKDNAMRNSLERFSRGRNDRDRDYQKFYMALSYIKVYRAQPEPEFIYLSDARIPPVIRDGMVHHQRKVLLTDGEDLLQNHPKQQQQRSNKANNKQDGGASEASDAKVSSSSTTILDEKNLQRKSKLERSPEETYFKYRGEEILIKSGLCYTIIRVAGFNELSTSEASTIDLVKSNSETSIVPVSRAEVAQVCVSALLDPCALNKCVYMTKKTVAGKNVLDEENISAKFEGIPTDVIR